MVREIQWLEEEVGRRTEEEGMAEVAASEVVDSEGNADDCSVRAPVCDEGGV